MACKTKTKNNKKKTKGDLLFENKENQVYYKDMDRLVRIYMYILRAK